MYFIIPICLPDYPSNSIIHNERKKGLRLLTTRRLSSSVRFYVGNNLAILIGVVILSA